MKKRYSVSLFVIVAFLLIFLHVLLLSLSASLSMIMVKEKYGVANLIIIRAFAVLASILTGFLVAFPMGYFSRQGTVLWGFFMPLVGIMVFFPPWQHESLQLLIHACWEWIGLFVSCGVFWYFGQTLRKKRNLAQQTGGADAENCAAHP